MFSQLLGLTLNFLLTRCDINEIHRDLKDRRPEIIMILIWKLSVFVFWKKRDVGELIAFGEKRKARARAHQYLKEEGREVKECLSVYSRL